MSRVAECHPERKHRAFGLCAQCYRKRYRKTNSEKIKKYFQDRKEKTKQYDHERYLANCEIVKKRTAQYAKDHPEIWSGYGRKYRTNNKEKEVKRHKKYNLENAEIIAQRTKKHREENKEKVSERHKKYYDNNPVIHRKKRLKKYGLTLEDYDKMFKKQQGVCAICGSDNKGRTLHVDHDHDTGKVRELLCNNCNIALGAFRDDVDIVSKAADYLKRHKSHD